MYYKLKRVTEKKDGLLRVCVAESNVCPTRYRTVDYNGTMEDLLISIQEGNFHCLPSCKLYETELLMEALARHAKVTNWYTDYQLRVNRSHELYRLIAACVVRKIKPGDAVQAIYHFDDETSLFYLQRRKELKDKGIVFIRRAIRNRTNDDQVVLITMDEDCIVAEREKYDNKGWLDNSDGRAIYLVRHNREEAEKMFNKLGYI